MVLCSSESVQNAQAMKRHTKTNEENLTKKNTQNFHFLVPEEDETNYPLSYMDDIMQAAQK